MTHTEFENAVNLLHTGNVEGLEDLLGRNSELASSRDEGNATLLLRLIDWPGYHPRSTESARVLLEHGVEVDARRDENNGTALAGVLCTMDIEVAEVLVEFGAEIDQPLGWMPGTCFSLADRICQDQGKQNDPKILKLIEIVSSATGRKIPTQAPFGGTTPLMFAKDVGASKSFYTEKLGFHVDWIHDENGEDPYVCISRGGTEFHLSRCKCEDGRHTGNLWVRVECDQLDEFYEEIVNKGVQVKEPPENYPWGFREMEVEDPDGNRFTFFGPTRED